MAVSLEDVLAQNSVHQQTTKPAEISDDKDILKLDQAVKVFQLISYKDMLDLETDLKIQQQALEELEMLTNSSEIEANAMVEWYRNRVRDGLADYRKGGQEKYHSSKKYNDFRARISDMTPGSITFNEALDGIFLFLYQKMISKLLVKL